LIRDAFLPLPLIPLVDGASVFRQAQSLPERVTLESPALEVMTDLKQVTALTTEPEASVEDANAKMIRNGVRLLFVTDPQHRLQGLITATDILGEKVLQAMQERGVARRDVLVHEIMTPRMRLEAIDMHEVRGAKVGHVLSTLKQAGRQHAIVVEIHQPSFHDRLVMLPHVSASQTLRGLFSTTQIARQLGLTLQSVELATTFAEVEVLLGR
jgi:CBS-domain-containing membrane protein